MVHMWRHVALIDALHASMFPRSEIRAFVARDRGCACLAVVHVCTARFATSGPRARMKLIATRRHCRRPPLCPRMNQRRACSRFSASRRSLFRLCGIEGRMFSSLSPRGRFGRPGLATSSWRFSTVRNCRCTFAFREIVRSASTDQVLGPHLVQHLGAQLHAGTAAVWS